MSSHDDGTGDTDSPGPGRGDGAIPKLTIGQRVLTALPNLQRQPRTTPRAPTGRSAGADPGDDETVQADEVIAPASDRARPSGRLRDSFVRPPGPAQPRGAPSGMSREELTTIIKRLDERERFLALVSAPLGIVVGLVLTIAAIHYDPTVHQKNHVSTGLILFEGGARVVLAGILVLAAVSRRRSFAAFALLFLGTSMGFPFALPFWALGIWLIFRVFKWQKELTNMTRGTTSRATTSRATTTSRPEPRTRASASDAATRRRAEVEARRRARADRLSARSGGRGGRGKKQPDPPGPPPSKRYTPPKTIRPKPPVP